MGRARVWKESLRVVGPFGSGIGTSISRPENCENLEQPTDFKNNLSKFFRC